MKTALKWVGWGLLGLIVLAAFSELDKTGQAVVFVGAMSAWAWHTSSKEAQRRHELQMQQLQEVLRRVDQIAASMPNTYAVDEIETWASDRRDARRADPHQP